MKAFAIFLIVLCLVVTGGIIYMLVTSNLVAVSVDCESGIPNEILFSRLKERLEEGAFAGTVFSDEELTNAGQYIVYTWTVRVENRSSLPSRVTEIRVLPMKGYDILQFDMNAIMKDSSPADYVIQPHSVSEIKVSVLSSRAIEHASSRADVRDATITWYFSGFPFPESNGKGGKLVLKDPD